MKIVIELPDDIQTESLSAIYREARALDLKPMLCSRDGQELYRKPAAVIRRVRQAIERESNAVR